MKRLHIPESIDKILEEIQILFLLKKKKKALETQPAQPVPCHQTRTYAQNFPKIKKQEKQKQNSSQEKLSYIHTQKKTHTHFLCFCESLFAYYVNPKLKSLFRVSILLLCFYYYSINPRFCIQISWLCLESLCLLCFHCYSLLCYQASVLLLTQVFSMTFVSLTSLHHLSAFLNRFTSQLSLYFIKICFFPCGCALFYLQIVKMGVYFDFF